MILYRNKWYMLWYVTIAYQFVYTCCQKDSTMTNTDLDCESPSTWPLSHPETWKVERLEFDVLLVKGSWMTVNANQEVSNLVCITSDIWLVLWRHPNRVSHFEHFQATIELQTWLMQIHHQCSKKTNNCNSAITIYIYISLMQRNGHCRFRTACAAAPLFIRDCGGSAGPVEGNPLLPG